MMGYAEELQNQSYDIKGELKIRKVLEKHTDWNIEFNKNDDPYDYDVKYYNWEKEDGKREKVHYGFVELEQASLQGKDPWVDEELPESWVFYSFLKRKVYDYDRVLGKWQGPKDDFRRTVYLKFNRPLTNCFATPVYVIYRDGQETPKSDGSYNDSYLALDLDHPEVRFGIEESLEFIDEFMEHQKDPQQQLGEFLLDADPRGDSA